MTIAGSNGRGVFSGNTFSGQVATVINDRIVRTHPLPAGFTSASAVDQNSWNAIAGYATNADGGTRPFILLGDTYLFLPVPDGYTQSQAQAINNRGDVAGVAIGSNSAPVAVVWPAGQAPVVMDPEVSSTVGGIDDDGSVLVNSGPRGPRVWKDGVLTRLASPPNLESQTGHGIKAGKIVGHAGYRFSSSPFIWDAPAAQPRPIAGGWRVWSINRAGLIAGQAGGHPGGPPAVWFAADPSAPEVLPVPAGYGELEVSHVSDDGQLVANNIAGIVAWKCHPKT